MAFNFGNINDFSFDWTLLVCFKPLLLRRAVIFVREER